MSDSINEKVEEYLKQLAEVDGSFHFQSLLQDLKQKALEDEKAIWFLFKSIVGDLIKDSNIWNEKTNLVVGIFYLLIDIGNEKAYALVKWYIQNFKEDTPNGAIELLSTLIPSFANINSEEYFTYLKSENKALSALGFLTLFNLSMERKLNAAEEKHLYEIAQTYTNDRYYTEHIVDMISFRFRKSEDSSQEESDKIDINLQ
ncbi:MAG TPA: hypothetical protein PK079_09600 [Leptospiraceae bacterium]|nr:hypothetical protein [Leptospiraceae bacterium]HMW04560.1 hypothetical protein [Leptospiraceae bacterium]HMX33445.1 hypothetical protein [Leptospiraceae bacterium]HMY30746.1 hypothetical protein [Leptospiraceae bacterium]HMZ64324.1 hypothetical protein [Leptospiraceae bacterium]